MRGGRAEGAFPAGPRRENGGGRGGRAARWGDRTGVGDYSMTSSTSMFPRVALEYGQ